jgi:hypothetical protein
MLDLLYREKYKMSEQKPSNVIGYEPKYEQSIKDLSDDTPCRPPPLTRMSTGAYIDGVFMTKDEMMCKMKMDSDKAKEKKDV